MKLYIVVAVWNSTKDNHAGMYHLAKEIKRKSEIPVKIIAIPTTGLHFLFWIYRIYAIIIGLYLRIVVKKEDTIWLMEYLLITMEQSDIARLIRGKANVVAIAHLIPLLITKHFSRKTILRKISYLDKLYVLGSSLKNFFINLGIKPEKIVNTFHYVDTEYYHPLTDKQINGKLKIICMGNMQRNFDELSYIISNCPNADFIVCMGKKNLTPIFEKMDNVILKGFIPEEELLLLMQNSDLSLNVMNDTIGSNVITTSLAVGLPVIASKVGSIGDYIDDGKYGILFESKEKAVSIINSLAKTPQNIAVMKYFALKKAETLNINTFLDLFFKENGLR